VLLVATLCKAMTMGRTTSQQRYDLRIIEPTFAALRWFNSQRFGESPTIGAALTGAATCT
jgi:hypothetical protein